MKKFNIISVVAVLAVVLSLTSCSKELGTSVNDDIKDPNAMIFDARVSQQIMDSDSEPQTRSNPLEDGAASAAFADGDVVAIMKSSGNDTSFAKYKYNLTAGSWEFQATSVTDPKPTTIEGNWDSGTPYWGAQESDFVWMTDGESRYFSAYYPTNETTSIRSFLLPADQSAVEKITSADYMLVDSYELTRLGHNTVNLDLERKTSRVIVEIVKNEREGLNFNKDTKVQFFSPSKGYEPGRWGGITFIEEELMVTPYYSETEAADGTKNPTYTALVLPDESIFTPIPFCEFAEFGMLLFRDATMKFEPGFSYHFKVTITAEAGYQWTMQLKPWTDEPIIDGDVPVETYYIYDEQDLVEFSALVHAGHSDITGYLMDDIDLTEVADWKPIGLSVPSDPKPFKGIFKGIDSESTTNVPVMRTIKGLKSSDGGLFGYVEGAEISDITLKEVVIESDYDDNVGAFIGKMSNDTKIDNCMVYTGGTVMADEQVGGVIGNISSGHITISNTLGKQTITLTGEQTGTVQGDEQVGGIIGAIGEAGSATISKIVNAASVSGRKKTSDNIGGLIGHIATDKRTDGTITRISESYNKANASVIGDTNVGGVIGRNESASLILEGCHNAGSVQGVSITGGLIGFNAGTIVASYNVGKVEYSSIESVSGEAAAGIPSSNYGGVTGTLAATGKIIGCFNAGEVLIKRANPTPGYKNISKTADYGYRGDGVVGVTEVGATVTGCYFMKGNQDETVGLPFFAMTAPALNWYKQGDTRDIYIYHLMIKAIDSFYDANNYQGTRYAFFPGAIPDGTSSSTLTKEEMQKIPFTGTYTADDPLSYIHNWGGSSSTIQPLAEAEQRYSIENTVNIINYNDALMLVSALSFPYVSGINDVLKDDLAKAYSYFYTDVKLHIDLDFSTLGNFSARVTGAYFGIFDGGNETLINYNDTKPFFSNISFSAGYAAEFKNVIFENPTIDTTEDNIGALLGSADYGTTIANCRIHKGSIEGGRNVGSLIGVSEANILNCHVDSTLVKGISNVGGIVGLIELTKSGTQKFLEDLGFEGILAFGGSTTSAIVEATGAKGIAGGIAGRASSDMDSELFNVESQGVSFTGTVTGNVVGAIAGQIDMAQTKIGFHGIENAGTIIAKGESPTIGGLVGIGNMIAGGKLEDMSAEPTISSLTVYAIAVSNTGLIDPVTYVSGTPKIGGMVGELRLNGSSIKTVTTTVDGAFETISAGSAFVPFIGNKSEMPNLSETFNGTYLSSLPSTGYPNGTFTLLPTKGTDEFTTAMGIINGVVGAQASPTLYSDKFTYDTTEGKLIFPPVKVE